MPENWKFSCEVPQEFDGLRADAILAKLHPQYSRNQWISWMKEGLIYSSGSILSPKTKLKAHQLIEGSVDLWTQQITAKAQDIPLNIMFEDEHLLIINKPQGLVVHPGAGQPEDTLMNALLNHQSSLEILPRAGIVHRLDKDTTGLMVIAKSHLSYQALIQMMQERQIERRYFALVHGIIRSGGTISTCYGRHPKNRLKMAVRPQGKIATTHYLIEEKFTQNTLLNIKLETGRTHQIRVHLQHLGYPIVGDPLYGKARAPGKGPITDALNSFPRQALHAHQLNFIHPIEQKPLTFDAILPDDFSHLLSILRE
jgi:23S rRNA pseudouridine1911/1915/1917 synthase